MSTALWLGVLIVVAVTPLVVYRGGRDVLVLPKTLVFETGMLVVGVLAAVGALLFDDIGRLLVRNRRAVMLAALATAWVAVAAMTAKVPEAAHSAPFTILCYALLFVVTAAVARDRPLLPALAAFLIPALVNAVVVLLQAYDVWRPFPAAGTSQRLTNVGLIGNPNTAATYLLLPTVAAIAAAGTLRRWRLAFAALAALAAILLWAIVQTETVTVLVAVGAAMLAFMVGAPRRARVAAIILAVVGVVAIFAYAPTRARLQRVAGMVRSGEIADATSGRLPAAATALQMFVEHPVTGIGPGGFAARYMPYRLRIEEQRPEWIRASRENFGEVHNDHAQILAEAGLPAYALFLYLLFSIGRMTMRTGADEDDRGRFVRRFALPGVVGFAALALGQFPLELTAVASSGVFAAGLCYAWGHHARS